MTWVVHIEDELVITVCESSTIGRSSLKVLLVEPESTNTFGVLVKLVIMSPCHGEAHGFESRTFRKTQLDCYAISSAIWTPEDVR